MAENLGLPHACDKTGVLISSVVIGEEKMTFQQKLGNGKLKNRISCVLVAGLTAVPTIGTAAISLDDKNKVSLFGDFRLRVEYDKRTNSSGVEQSRDRFRYRARLGVSYKVNDKWSAAMRLATGASALNSPHVSFGTNDGSKGADLGLDQAYVAYTPSQSLTVVAGKTPLNYWQSSEMFWDKDINPDAFAIVYKAGPVTLNGAYAMVNEGSWGDDVDVLLYQAVYKGEPGGMKVKAAVGGASLDAPAGTFQAEDHYMLNGELRTGPWRFGAEYLKSDATVEDTGYVLESRYKLNGTVGFRLYYFHVEAHAPLGDGTFSQDDFPNPGATGVSNFKGFRLQMDYKIDKNVNLDVRYYDMERIVDTATLGASTSDARFNDRDRYRIQANLNLKF